MDVSPVVRRRAAALAGLVVFLLALAVLRRELSQASLSLVQATVARVEYSRIVAAMLLTALNYAVLAYSDILAIKSIGRRLHVRKVAAASFIAYAISNNVGFALVSGVSVRSRFYTRWGLSWEEISRVVIAYSTTFWVGLLALGGAGLALAPLPSDQALMSEAAHSLGWVLFAMSFSVIVLALRPRTVRFRSFEWTPPAPAIAFGQWLISLLDWTLAAGVVWVLLPPGHVPIAIGLSAFVVSQLAGLASHIPGGIGVFEGSMVLLLKPYVSSSEIAGALVLYRAIYYLLPLQVAIAGLLIDEYRQRRHAAARAVALIGRITPQALSILTFLAGMVLLFSGATPAAANRLAWLERFVPLSIVESSHFAGSLLGVLLLLLSHGIARRLDAAYHLAVLAAASGIAASLLKGIDIEEALFLTVVLLTLWQARGEFDRRTALFATPFSATWTAAVVAGLLASFWLGEFAFKHVEYRNELWWQFELSADAPRFLRASVGASIVVVLFAAARLLTPAAHEIDSPTEEDLDDAAKAIRLQPYTTANLVFLRDKGLIFDADRQSFVMYAVQGRTWVAMGDPVGPDDRIAAAVRAFLERCDDFGATPAFYEVRKSCLHHYADFGLSFLKLGEEARVDLAKFHLEGGDGSRFRQAAKRLDKAHASFRIVQPAEIPPMLEQLRRVSDHWLGHKPAEKGFSLGFFDEDYLQRFPLAVVERDGEVIAFANIWTGGEREEASIDLMRYDDRAPAGVMESLIVKLMLWAKGEGYHWFSLGMAPLSGLEPSPAAPMWSRLGALAYTHGEGVYNFQGLRAFKEKFNPEWEPHYLAYRGTVGLPRTIADVTALIAGGYRRLLGGDRRRPRRAPQTASAEGQPDCR